MRHDGPSSRARRAAHDPRIANMPFGLSDFREAWALDSWLVWAKAANLVALLWIRRWVLRSLYPGARVL